MTQVQAILDHFNIDGGNPLMVITQEMAKTFLCGGCDQYSVWDVRQMV
jgi:hypothetical protein